MTTKEELGPTLDAFYEVMDGSEAVEEYHRRHGIQSLGILTVVDDEYAALVADWLRPRIEGRTVVEIGAGVGLLSFHVAQDAKRVWAIEADPCWASSFVFVLYAKKPKNVSYLFGAADEFAGTIKADVAIFCTHSGQASMRKAGLLFAPEVIDVYAELLTEHSQCGARTQEQEG